MANCPRPSPKFAPQRAGPEAPTPSTSEHLLSDGLIGALYVARCRDCGVEPTPNGARRFHGDVVKNHARDDPARSREVHLPALRLGSRSTQVLARGISRPTVLQLHGNTGLGDQGAQALLGLLEHGSCRWLDLGACGLGASFAPTLARYMLRSNGAGSNFERLELGGATGTHLQKPNQLRGVAALSAVLQQRSPKLSHLGLSHCAIGYSAESASCAHALAALAAHAPVLRTLDVAANGFGRAAAPLLQLLPVYPALTELDVSGNELGDWGAEALATALLAASVPSGEELAMYVRTLPGAAGQIAGGVLCDPRARAGLRTRACQLTSLAVSDNRIQVGGARALALAVGGCSSLRHFSINDNPLSDEGVAAIASALAPPPAAGWDATTPGIAPPTKPPPAASASALETLNLCGCGIGVAGAQALGQVLTAGTLRELRVARNTLADLGVQALAVALRASPTLALLDLSGCRVTDRAALLLIGALARATHGALRTLKLHDNLLSDKCGQAMLRQLTSVARRPPPPLPPSRKLGLKQQADGARGYGARGNGRLAASKGAADRSGWASSPPAGTIASPRNASPRNVMSPRNVSEVAPADASNLRTITDIEVQLDALFPERPGRGTLHHITTHGNQLSFTTCAALRDLAVANRQTEAVSPEMEQQLFELSSNVPALHKVEHQLARERATFEQASARHVELEAALAELRARTAEQRELDESAHEEAATQTAEALAEVAQVREALQTEQALFVEKRDALDAQTNALVQRKLQLERLDEGSSTPARSRRRPSAANPNVPEPPALDAQLQEALAKEHVLFAELAENEMREKRAIVNIRWAEDQMALMDVHARAKVKALKAPAKKR